MKNKIKSVFAVLLPLLATTACQKDVSLEPIQFQPTTISNEAQVYNQLAGTYNALSADQMYGQGLWGYLTAGADESFRQNATANTVLTEYYNIAPSETNIYTYWRNLYAGVERANVLLDVIDKIQMAETKKNETKGQAIFLRAYCYYLLANHFGDVPLKTELSSNLDGNFNILNTPAKQVYDYVIQEMTKAEALVPLMQTAQTTTIVTKTAVQGILARVCLSMAGEPIKDETKYAQALQWAEKVITSNTHSLNAAPMTQYPTTPAYAKVFINNMQNNVNDRNITEGIWDAAFLSKSNATGAYAGTGYPVTQTLGAIMGLYCPDATASSVNGFSPGTYRVHSKFFNLFEKGDLRRDWAAAPYLYKDGTTKRYFSLLVTLTGGGGTGAAATAYTTKTGAIDRIVVDNPGSGYTTAPIVTFSSYGTNTTTTEQVSATNTATATATIANGQVTGFTITKASSGYPTSYDRCVGKWRRENELNLPSIRLQNNTSCNFPIIRYADVLLMAAEADLKTKGAPSVSAVEYFNQVRRRAFGFNPTAPAPTIDKTTFTLQDIIDERSRELCFEGQRRADLIRWGIMEKVMRDVVTENANNAPTAFTVPASLAANNFLTNPAKYQIFPKPTLELSANPAMKQNDNW